MYGGIAIDRHDLVLQQRINFEWIDVPVVREDSPKESMSYVMEGVNAILKE